MKGAELEEVWANRMRRSRRRRKIEKSRQMREGRTEKKGGGCGMREGEPRKNHIQKTESESQRPKRS